MAEKKDVRGTPTIPFTHPGFWLACGFGALGVLVIVVGLIVGVGQIVFVIATFLGFLSLVSALGWRADLVSAWKRDHTPR